MPAQRSDTEQAFRLLEERLAVAEETLRAIRAGEIDAIVTDTREGGQRIYTLETEDRPYFRGLLEVTSAGATAWPRRSFN
jgi:hypothetical protein